MFAGPAGSEENRPQDRAGAASATSGPAFANAPVDAAFAAAQSLDRRDAAARQLSPRERALRATVRLTVESANFRDIATGTIIDTHGDEALVVTCGHVFRDSAGKGRISVEFCGLPGAAATAGQLITYDASQCDIGLVAIRPGFAVDTVPVAPSGFAAHERMSVFSIGCDNGGPASVLESRVSGINRYVGPPNIVVSGAPTEGRSGGGLFTSDGLLIGICNAADKSDDEGLYGALPTIHSQLAAIGLQRLFKPGAAESADGGVKLAHQPEPSVPALPPQMPGQSFEAAAAPRAAAANGDVELIFIVRPRDGGAGRSEAVVISNPSRELLDLMGREAQRGGSLNIAGEAPPSRAFRNEYDRPIIRGQSQQ
jgi:hypothetical protein